VLRDLTLANGYVTHNSPTDWVGGAVAVTTADLTLANCVLTGHFAHTYGGAVHVAGGGGLTVVDSVLSGNAASGGGAVFVNGAGTRLTFWAARWRRTTAACTAGAWGGPARPSGSRTPP
jgi:hypothetical protein